MDSLSRAYKTKLDKNSLGETHATPNSHFLTGCNIFLYTGRIGTVRLSGNDITIQCLDRTTRRMDMVSVNMQRSFVVKVLSLPIFQAAHFAELHIGNTL